MKVALQVEGQRGLTWTRWQRFAEVVESLGFDGLFRSDHFLDAEPPDQASLSLWPALTWLACNTKRLEFGPLVTPLSFRHPVHTARIAKDVDDLSGGRLVLGVGAGWGGGQREHNAFGFDILDIPQRFARYEEGLQVISGLLHSDRPVTFDGEFYHLQNAVLLPRPRRKGGPPILVGGNGPKRVLPMAARYADEWNAIFRTPAQFSALSSQLDQLLDQLGRPRQSVERSQMMGLIFGKNSAEIKEKLAGKKVDEMVARGYLAGSASQIVDQLGQYEAAGLTKVMLHWADLDDFAGLEAFAKTILVQIQNDPMIR